MQIAILLAMAIYTNSANHCHTETDKITKETRPVTVTVVWRVKIVDLAFEPTEQSLSFFFQSHSLIYSHLISAWTDIYFK